MIVWTAGARADLAAIDDYIGEDNPAAAIAVLEHIRTRAEVLNDHPKIGRLGRAPGTRELFVTGYPYLLVYELHGDAIRVMRVKHHRQKWP